MSSIGDTDKETVKQNSNYVFLIGPLSWPYHECIKHSEREQTMAIKSRPQRWQQSINQILDGFSELQSLREGDSDWEGDVTGRLGGGG